MNVDLSLSLYKLCSVRYCRFISFGILRIKVNCLRIKKSLKQSVFGIIFIWILNYSMFDIFLLSNVL